MADLPPQQFISEPVTPAPGSFDPAAMSRGEPGLPSRFIWREQSYALAAVIRAWKTTGTDRGEVYLRRHWYTITTTTGQQMTLYCERQARNTKRPRQRWWLYSLASS